MLSYQAAHTKFVVFSGVNVGHGHTQQIFYCHNLQAFRSLYHLLFLIVSEHFYEPRHLLSLSQGTEPGNIPKATFTFSMTKVSQNTDKGTLDVSKPHIPLTLMFQHQLTRK